MPGGLQENMCVWSTAEDTTLLWLIKEYDTKWSRMLSYFPGRSVSALRNRWQRILRGRRLVMEGKAKNRCKACGLPKSGHVCKMLKMNESRSASDGPSTEDPDFRFLSYIKGEEPQALCVDNESKVCCDAQMQKQRTTFVDQEKCSEIPAEKQATMFSDSLVLHEYCLYRPSKFEDLGIDDVFFLEYIK